MAVGEEGDFGFDVVDCVDDEGGLLAVFFPWFELGGGSAFVVELVAGVELRPGHDLFEAALQAGDFGGSDVCERGDCVSVQRAESDLVEVDETDLATA